MIWIGVERGGGAWLPPTYLKYTWELWKELSGRSLEQMLGVGSKVNNVGLAGGLIRLSTDFTHYEKVWKLGERRGRLFWFCKHVCCYQNVRQWTLWRKQNLKRFTLTFIHRYGMNIISDMNNGKELRMQVSCHAVMLSPPLGLMLEVLKAGSIGTSALMREAKVWTLVTPVSFDCNRTNRTNRTETCETCVTCDLDLCFSDV